MLMLWVIGLGVGFVVGVSVGVGEVFVDEGITSGVVELVVGGIEGFVDKFELSALGVVLELLKKKYPAPAIITTIITRTTTPVLVMNKLYC